MGVDQTGEDDVVAEVQRFIGGFRHFISAANGLDEAVFDVDVSISKFSALVVHSNQGMDIFTQ
jgi:hypothetical protein